MKIYDNQKYLKTNKLIDAEQIVHQSQLIRDQRKPEEREGQFRDNRGSTRP